MWLEVTDVGDLAALTGAMKARGATTENLEFDTSREKGTTWTEGGSVMQTVLLVYGPWLLIFAVFMIVLRQMRNQGGAGGVMSFGRSRAQLYTKENHTNVTFDDVAGAQEAKEEVSELVEFLKSPGRFTRIGGRIPRGVLLVGQPGCGKTLLAKAIAGEAEVPFFSISGSDFVEMFVGVGASRVRDLFKQARDNSPCIIFLDEIDAVGRRRGSGMGGGHDEREQTLNAILVEMDGFGTDEGIIVIAATNRPDVLDPALLRPGRFDREVTIDLPDVEGRKAILEVHLKKVKTGKDIDVMVLARSTPGYSGADLAATVNEAAIMAVLAKKDEVAMEHLEEARDKVRYGRQKKSRSIEEEDRKITAYHEAGHALVAAELEDTEDPHKVTIVPRGRALGSTMMLPEKESYHMQKRRLVAQLAVLFGGRVAEEVFCGDISAGASDDIKRATELARAMVTELGMSDAIGPINYAERQGSDFLGTELGASKWHSEETARAIDGEVQRLIREAHETARRIIAEGRTKIEALCLALLHYETLSASEIQQAFAGVPVEDLRPTPEPEPERPAPASGGVRVVPLPGGGRRGDLPGGAAPSPPEALPGRADDPCFGPRRSRWGPLRADEGARVRLAFRAEARAPDGAVRRLVRGRARRHAGGRARRSRRAPPRPRARRPGRRRRGYLATAPRPS
ncbi:MAG: ATP-dependent zinc metalloprotease FtsH [Planctomycetes bacterium]|nr:ATP-dependent zinc metalloprotease FtsH [Planctomycetota bacterium]